MSAERIWLVKSSTRVLGPFTFEEIARLLKLKQVSAIDEVRSPSVRWMYIRDKKEFLDTMRSLRNQPELKEDTQTGSATVTMTSLTKTVTEVTQNLVDDSHTPTPIPPKPEPVVSPQFKDVTPAKGTMPSVNESVALKSYGVATDLNVQSQVRSSIKTFWYGFAIVLVLLSGVFSYKKFFAAQKKVISYADYVSLANQSKSQGLYSKATDFLEKAEALQALDAEVLYKNADLKINYLGQTLEGRKILESALLEKTRTKNEVVEGQNLIGISYFREQNLKSAEDAFNIALGFDPTHMSAQINLGYLYGRRGAYIEAKNLFDKLRTNVKRESVLSMNYIFALIELAKNGGSSTDLQAALSEARESTSRTVENRQKLLIINAYLEQTLNSGNFQVVADKAIDEIPESGNEHIENLSLLRDSVSWDRLTLLCNELYQTDGVSPKVKALLSICYTNTSREGEALKLIEAALDQTPQDSQLLALYAWSLNRMGRSAEASAALKLVTNWQLKLANHVSALICYQKNDSKCAEEFWLQVLTIDPNNLVAYTGLAQIYLDQGNEVSAIDQVKRGLAISSTYRPLIELRDQIERKK
jgi:tetratricopeptide (TPR) repeat protein